MEVRRLSTADAPAHRALRLQALQSDPDAYATSYEEAALRTVASFAERLKENPDQFSLGAFDGEAMVGTVTFLRESAPKTRHKASIVAMYVDPAYRQRGIGRLLMAAVIAQARVIPGLEQLQLAVVTSNTPALKLYQSMGFSRFGVEIRALKRADGYLDEAHMVLFL